MASSEDSIWCARIRYELVANILPFWRERMVDPRGGFYGYADCDGVIDVAAPRASVVNSRLLWTFSTALRTLGGTDNRDSAEWARDYVLKQFVDAEYGGLYWMVAADGRPLADRKQIYAQAFGIYALAEFVRATGDAAALAQAVDLYNRIEAHAADPVYGGYIEALDRRWQPLADMRLSDKDLNSPKSMNTHLHVMEAYTNLLRVWRDPALLARQTALIGLTLDHIVDGDRGHFKLFFGRDWTAESDHVSFGHDIEGSWLLVEAAEVVGDPALSARVRAVALTMAERTLLAGRDRDGSLFYEADGHGRMIDADKHWWPQAEALVGFYNAYEMTGERRYREAAVAVWDFIETRVADRVHGEWHAKLGADGQPRRPEQDADVCLAGPWKCPYHNSRACFEMMARLGG
jgi:mannobiose 2-epimerase